MWLEEPSGWLKASERSGLAAQHLSDSETLSSNVAAKA